jgi:uncharacterized protein YeaO (DUF488 family)
MGVENMGAGLCAVRSYVPGPGSGKPSVRRSVALSPARYAVRMSAKSRIRIERVYHDIDTDEGQRVLVDRLWPRGIRKDDPRVGIWCKDVAPSKELREWYHHQPERFDEFVSRYEAELADNTALEELRTMTSRGVVTLVTATRDLNGSHAAVLAKLLKVR